MNFLRVTRMQIFNFRDSHVTTFCTLQGPISIKCLITDSPDYQKAHFQSLSFPSMPLVWSKTVSCRLCAGQSKDTLKREKKSVFWIWLRPRYKIPEFFFTIAPVLTSTLTVCRRKRGDPSSLCRTEGALQVL